MTTPADGRTSTWQVRLRLYTQGELEGDTDDDRPPQAPGAAAVNGLPAVALWAAQILAQYHGEDAPEAVAYTFFAQRLPSLRVLIGRERLKYTQPLVEWRVPYAIPSGEWVARITLLQCGEAQSTASRRLTR